MSDLDAKRLSTNTGLTDGEFRAAVANTLHRLVAKHGREKVALVAGCTVRTIDNARLEHTSLHGASLFNLLALDPTALNTLAGHFGGHFVPVESADGPGIELLADTAKLVALHGAALTDNRIDHLERAQLVEAARPVVQGWAAVAAKGAR